MNPAGRIQRGTEPLLFTLISANSADKTSIRVN